MIAGSERRDQKDWLSRGRNSRIGVNALVNAFGGVAYSTAVVVTTPVAIHFLGETRWGVWQLINAAAAFGLLLNLGLNSAVSYHVSRNLDPSNHPLLGSSINNARIYFIAAAVMMCAIFALIGEALVESLVEPSLVQIAHEALAISVVITAATLPVRIYLSVLSGMQRYDLLAVFRIVTGLALLVCVFVGFMFDMGLVGFVAIMSVAPAAPALFAWLASRRLLPSSCLRWGQVDYPKMRAMIGYSVSTLLYTMGSVILFQSLKMIAAWRCGGAISAGHMGLVVNLVTVLSAAFLPLAAVLHTRTADLHSRGLEAKVSVLLYRSMAAIGLLAIPTVVFLMCEVDSVFRAWVGGAIEERTIQRLATTARWMLLGEGLYIVFLPGFYALVGVGEHFRFGVGMIAAGIASTAAAWLASGILPQISSLGAAFGICIGVLVIVVTAPAAIRRFSLNTTRLLRDAVAIPLALSAPGAVAMSIRPHSDNPAADLLLAAFLFGLPTAPAVMWFRTRASAADRRDR